MKDAGERNKRVHEIAKRLFPMDEDCWPEAEALILEAIRDELEAVRQMVDEYAAKNPGQHIRGIN